MDINRYEIISGTQVPEVITKKINGKTTKFVPYVISEDNGEYKWTLIQLTPANYTYAGLVDAIINLHYHIDEMMAVLNNYTAEPKNTKYKNEFLEMQNCRKAAKEYAKKHFNM